MLLQLLLAGCSEEPLVQGGDDAPQMELIPLHFSVANYDVAETRGTTVEEGTLSEVGVFLMSEGEYKALLAGEVVYKDNSTLDKNNVEVSFPYYHNIENLKPYNADRNNIKFSVSEDNVLAPEEEGLQLYYSTTGGTVVFAYAPYKEGMTKEMLFQPESVAVPGNQSTDDLITENDFYLATPVMKGGGTGNPVRSMQKYITLEFRHQYARLVLASNDKSLQNMCWNLAEGTEADRVAVYVKDVPTKGTWKLNSEGTDFDFGKTETGRIFMAEYSLVNGKLPDTDTITSTALVLPDQKGAAPRFGIVFYNGTEELKTVPLSVRGGDKNVILKRGESKTFSCNYGEEDKLRDAFVRAQDYTLYTLNEDVVLHEPLELEAGKSMTLNLNGHSISMEKECTAAFEMILNLGDLTIIDEPVANSTRSKVRGDANGDATKVGKISFKDTGVADPSFGRGSYTINNKGKLVVNGGLIENLSEQNTDKAVHMYCAIQQLSGTTIVNGGVVSNPTYRSIRINKGALIVNGGIMEGQVWLQPNQGNVTIEVSGGEFSPSGVDASSIFMENNGKNYTVTSAKISGGTFQTKIGCSIADKTGVKGCIIGGRFTETAMQNTNEALFAEGYRFEKNGEYYELVEGPSILENLQNAFKNGGEYVLEGDVVLPSALTLAKGKTLVLDLNGHSISHEMECTASYNMITNNGDLTIKGEGKISFTDTGVADPSFGRGSYTINNKGTLVVNGGLIENLSEQNKNNVVHMYCAIQQSSGTTTVNGGVVSNPTYRSIRINNGALIVNGGTMEGQVWVQPNQRDVTLKVNGGDFSPRGVDNSSIYLENGTNDIEFSVTGGTFNTKIGADQPDNEGVKGSVKGGTFTEAAKTGTNPALIAEGYDFVSNGDGTYTVMFNQSSVGVTDEKANPDLEALGRKQ